MNIKLFDDTLPMPEYQTSGAVGFDLYAREDVKLKPWVPTFIPVNIAVQIPSGYMLVVASRSSTADKYGFILANSVGIIDPDYCGDDDELKLKVLNFTRKTTTIRRGDRIAQAILVKVSTPKLKRVSKLSGRNRGGFGTTGQSV